MSCTYLVNGHETFPIVMSEMFILILNLFRHFYWKSHSWRFPKRAEWGFIFLQPGAICREYFGDCPGQTGFDRITSSSLPEIYRSLFITRDDTIDSGCETWRVGHYRIFKLSFRSNPRTFGELPNSTHPHERESHRNPKIFSRRN